MQSSDTSQGGTYHAHIVQEHGCIPYVAPQLPSVNLEFPKMRGHLLSEPAILEPPHQIAVRHVPQCPALQFPNFKLLRRHQHGPSPRLRQRSARTPLRRLRRIRHHDADPFIVPTHRFRRGNLLSHSAIPVAHRKDTVLHRGHRHGPMR